MEMKQEIGFKGVEIKKKFSLILGSVSKLINNYEIDTNFFFEYSHYT